MARQEKSRQQAQFNLLKALPFEKTNYLLFGAGLLVLVLGYVALSWGEWDSWMSLNIGPILLVLGYCVIFPAAILYRKRRPAADSE